MKFLLYAYCLFALISGVSGFVNSGWFVGLAGILGPLLAVWAGIGISASFRMGRKAFFTGILFGCTLYWIADWLVRSSGYFVNLFNVGFGGGTWILLGLVLAIFATKQKHLDSTSFGQVPKVIKLEAKVLSREDIRDQVIRSLPSNEVVWFAVPYPSSHPSYSEQMALYSRVEKQVDELMKQQEKN